MARKGKVYVLMLQDIQKQMNTYKAPGTKTDTDSEGRADETRTQSLRTGRV